MNIKFFQNNWKNKKRELSSNKENNEFKLFFKSWLNILITVNIIRYGANGNGSYIFLL